MKRPINQEANANNDERRRRKKAYRNKQNSSFERCALRVLVSTDKNYRLLALLFHVGRRAKARLNRKSIFWLAAWLGPPAF